LSHESPRGEVVYDLSPGRHAMPSNLLPSDQPSTPHDHWTYEVSPLRYRPLRHYVMDVAFEGQVPFQDPKVLKGRQIWLKVKLQGAFIVNRRGDRIQLRLDRLLFVDESSMSKKLISAGANMIL